MLGASRSQPVRVVSVVTALRGVKRLPAHACAVILPPPCTSTYWPWFFTDSVPGVVVVAEVTTGFDTCASMLLVVEPSVAVPMMSDSSVGPVTASLKSKNQVYTHTFVVIPDPRWK